MKIKLLTLSLLSSLFSACGTDQQLQPGSSVVIDPATRDIEIVELLDVNGLCIFSEDTFVDSPVAIRVLVSTGGRVGNAVLSVYTAWSGSSFRYGFDGLEGEVPATEATTGIELPPGWFEASLADGAELVLTLRWTDEGNRDARFLGAVFLSAEETTKE